MSATATSAGWTYTSTGNAGASAHAAGGVQGGGEIDLKHTTDNDTFACDIAFAASDGHGSGLAYLVAVGDNGTGVQSYVSSDNGSTWADIIPRNADEAGAITDISVVMDTQLKLPVFAANAAGKVYVSALDNSTGTYSWDLLIAPGVANAQAASRVSIAALSDGKAFAVGYESATGDNATVQVFYDE